MSFPSPEHYGVDAGDFSGRDAGLGRYYYGDGWKGGGDGGGDGCSSCGCLVAWIIFLAVLVFFVWIELFVLQ